METQGREKQQRLILVPGPFQGHMTPMLQLGSALHSKGFSITIVHSKYNSPDPSSHPDFDFYPLSDNISDDDHSRPGVVFLEILNSRCSAEFQNYLAHTVEQHKSSEQVVAIIHDNLMFFPEAVASSFKIPSLIFRASNTSYLLAYLAIPRLHAEGYLPLQDSILQELVPELDPLRFKDLPLSHHLTLEDTKKLLTVTSSTRTSSAIIWNTIDCLEQKSLTKVQQHFQVPIFAIGPLHKFAPARSTSFLKEDRSCIEWLDKQAPNSVIYASIGSGVIIDEKELVETAWGLANSDQPFLWVVRPGSVHGSEWIELLPEGFIEKVGERGCLVKWAPQKEVLAHGAVGGFWSHCGWNSTLESISEGVPMICRPCFFDQKVNARYLSYVWKVGLEVELVLGRAEIASVIRRLLVNEEGKEIKQRAIEMKEKIKACIQEGGSSCKSLNDLAEFLSPCLPNCQGRDTSDGHPFDS